MSLETGRVKGMNRSKAMKLGMRRLQMLTTWGAGCLALALLMSAPRVNAQDAPKGQAKEDGRQKTEANASRTSASSPEGQNSQSSIAAPELPTLLLVVQRPQGTAARRDDINTSLSLLLRASVRESRKYQVILYSADYPSIRRALLEHAIAASELVEPIKPEALQKLAKILGAKSILTVGSTLDKIGLKTDVQLMQDTGNDMWMTPLAQPFILDAQMGKLRLKTDQMLALTVDNIDGYLGIPSHLADNIHLNKTRLIGKPIASKDKKPKNGKEADKPKEDVAANANTSTEGGEQGVRSPGANGGGSGAGIKPGGDANIDPNAPHTSDRVKRDASKAGKSASTQAAKSPRDAQPAKNDATLPTGDTDTNGSPRAETGKANPDTQPPPRENVVRPDNKARNSRNQPAILTTDTGAILLAEPNIVPPVPPTDKVDHEAAADRYRRIGDLPNSIAALRQAINASPRDLHLRKKLIVAYQDRQLLDMAVSETERAMQMAPTDPDLSRLYAGSLIAKGDTPTAIKLLRDVVTANPKDAAAQVALGDALMADGQFAEALNTFDTAGRNDPKSPLPHRRLARVLAARAGSDVTQYAACLQQITQARSLTPPTETQTYQGDYFEIMLLMESRLKDMLDQVNETYGHVGKQAPNDLLRTAADLKERAEAASDFLDKLPPAAGQDVTHAQYAQGAALLAQSIGYLRKYIPLGDMQLADSLRGTRLDALAQFASAHARLLTARAALEKSKAAIGVTVNN